MADTRTDAERQRDLVGVDAASRLVGIEQIERWQRIELENHAVKGAVIAANKMIGLLVTAAGGEVRISRRTQERFDMRSIIEVYDDIQTGEIVVKVTDA